MNFYINTLFLAGDLLTWGANDFDQLGLGISGLFVSVPSVVSSLVGIPFAFIVCGANHSFALSKSGAIYGWGLEENPFSESISNNRFFFR